MDPIVTLPSILLKSNEYLYFFLLVLSFLFLVPENLTWGICYPELLGHSGALNFVGSTTVASGVAFQGVGAIKNSLLVLAGVVQGLSAGL